MGKSSFWWLPLLVATWHVAMCWWAVAVEGGASAHFSGKHRDRIHTGIIIPGFASSRLHAWAHYDCPMTPLDFSPLDPVWIDMQKVMGATSCWMRCISLHPRNQTDLPECKSRVDHGLSAITELSPGFVTGPLSSVWRAWVNWMAEFDVDYEAIVAMPYDWRLPPSRLEERDLFFHKLRITFEASRKLRGPAIVFAHSLGNQVFRYFLEWLKHHVAPRAYQRWINRHIHAYYAIAAPFLGTPEALRGLMSGITFGLPISLGMARRLGNSWGSSLWMYPFSPLCQGRQHPPWHWYQHTKHSHGEHGQDRYQCRSSKRNFSGWPTPAVSLSGVRSREAACMAQQLCRAGSDMQHATTRLCGSEDDQGAAIPDNRTLFLEERQHARLCQEEPPCADRAGAGGAEGEQRQQSEGEGQGLKEGERLYSAQEVADGTFLGDIASEDADAAVFSEKLAEWYLDDPILNPLTAWDRPPIKNVFCAYGINLKTEVGFAFSPSGRPHPDNWDMEDVWYETEGGHLKSRSGLPLQGNPFPASGDITVPYFSLSWCKSWLGTRVNITRAPMVLQQAHTPDDVQRQENVAHVPGEAEGMEGHLYPEQMGRAPGTQYITYYEDSASTPGHRTAVWELDKVDHRTIVSSHTLLREIWLEILHETHPNASLPFVRKDYREPMRDEDCHWDYTRACCAMTEHCEYRYVFGDIHLGQSCRLKRGLHQDLFMRYM